MRTRSLIAVSGLLAAVLRADGAFEHDGDACRIEVDPVASWLVDLPVTPALAAPPSAKSKKEAIEADDLDGEWTGDMTLSTVQSSLKQVETMMAPYTGTTKPLRADAVPSPGAVRLTMSSGGSPFTCPFTYAAGKLVCDTTTSGHSMHWEATVIRDGNMLRIAGAWQSSHPLLKMSGRFRLEKIAEPDTELEILYPAGKSPQIFVTGWPFGVRCIEHKGTKDEKDISKDAKWSGTGTFEPPVGDQVVSHFSAVGWNKMTVTCGDAKRTLALLTASTTGYARLGDRAKAPADAHGCPACAHTVVGPIVSGSPNVYIDDRPAARVGDRGVHAACCNQNTFVILTGNPSILINGRPAAMLSPDRESGSRTQHCGGQGSVIEGSPGSGAPRGDPGLEGSGTGGGGGFFGVPFGAGGGAGTGPGTGPAGRGTNKNAKAPASSAPPPALAAGSVAVPPPPSAPITDARGSEALSLEAPPNALKIVRNTLPGATRPTASLAILPRSAASRTADGSLSLERGGVVVTTFGAGAKQVVVTPEGTITLGSQARIARLDDGVDVALLSGAAKIAPKNGAPFDLAEGSRVKFAATGPRAPPAKIGNAELATTFASFAYPESAVPAKGTGSLGGVPILLLAAALGAGVLVIAILVVIIVVVMRRKPGPTPALRR